MVRVSTFLRTDNTSFSTWQLDEKENIRLQTDVERFFNWELDLNNCFRIKYLWNSSPQLSAVRT